MLDRYLNLLMKFHKQKRTQSIQAISLFFGGVIFLFILPSLFFLVAEWVNRYVQFDFCETCKWLIVMFSLLLGLFWLIWATISQLKIGHGTPAPNVPTQFLIITGPYQYTRNPIELGALFYYFGFGWLFGTALHGMVCLVLGFIIGSSYHKFIEEKELVLRFGDDYKKYRDSTPFLIPRFKKITG